MTKVNKRLVITSLVLLAAVGGYYALKSYTGTGLPTGIVSGNGRIEAVEIDIATKTAGRVQDVLASEGQFVKAGEILARMNTDQLEAKRREAEAQLRRAMISVDTAKSFVAQREAERKSAEAVITQRQVEHDAAVRRLARSEQLAKTNTTSQQVLDDDRASEAAARAAVAAAEAQLAATEAAIGSAKAQVIDAESAVEASQAVIDSVTADINDSTLRAPRDGRVQYLVAQPGEVLSAGGRVLNLVDLADVYMTFFLPTAQAGRLRIGSEVRIVLDAAPQYIIPARISFLSDVAQFTPKTVETQDEREKLMFRVRAQISPDLLRKYIQFVKTGLPGMVHVRLDPDAEWPAMDGTVVE